METTNSFTVGLKFKEDTGILTATVAALNGPVTYEITGLSEGVQNKIKKYMNKIRTFRIPQSMEIDDYEEYRGKPLDNETFFRLALCTLKTNTGIRVIW